MDGLDTISRLWPYLVAAGSFLAATVASIHALLHKRDPRAATLWLGLIWLMPLLGSVLYLALGINRIRRRALSLRSQNPARCPPPEDLGEPQESDAAHLKMLARVVDSVVNQPLVPGNFVHPLRNGDEAFPAMIEAINFAKTSLTLATYIFDNDESGKQFAAALARAQARQVAVRVLIDDAGARYSWPSITHDLRRARVKVAHFLPTRATRQLMAINLRNHRKLLVADGRMAFTGGINIPGLM